MKGRGVAVAAFALASVNCGGGGEVPGRVTFNDHVAPIVHANCSSCHRPGQVAPFPLLTYDDVRAQAAEIARETLARQMPPWLPAEGEFQLQGARRLTDAQIETIQRWVRQGLAEGDPSTRRPVPAFPDGWESGVPDAVATLSRPYVLRPGGPDIYRNVVIRAPVDAARFIRAVEFHTNGAPIHHAVIRVDRSGVSRRRDGGDGSAGFDGMSWSASDPDGQFIGWAPGRGPIRSPEGMAWTLEPGTDLVVEMHMIPADVEVPVAPSVGLFFADAPPTRRPITLKLGSKAIDIAAGRTDHLITDSYVFPVPVELLSVYPHAHYLGKDMLVTLTMPDGRARTLLHIPRWNFHWQQDYRFVSPVAVPAGARITMRYTYDNSTGNPFNPSTPPVRVLAGPRSNDEMAELGLQVLTASREDAAQLNQVFAEREQRANIQLGEHRVRLEPDNAEYRAFLGGSYAEAGRFGEALPHLEAAARLGDRTAATQSDLGAAKMALGRPAEALEHFRRAVAAAPEDERLHFNLGTTLAALFRVAEAEAAYRRAQAINPGYADPYTNLGVIHLGRRRFDDAVAAFAKAAQLEPNAPVMHSNLAGALIAAGRPRDALAAVRRALDLDPAHGPSRDTLRRLEAMGVR